MQTLRIHSIETAPDKSKPGLEGMKQSFGFIPNAGGLARALIKTQGHAADADLASFTAAGYAPAQALEVIAGIAISTMAGLTANLAQTPLEERFQPQAWNPA